MKKLIGLILVTLITVTCCIAGTVTIKLSTDADAQIFVNGSLVSSGKAEIKVSKNSKVNVKVKKAGYISEERNYNNDGVMKLPKSEFITLQKDASYASSSTNDLANRDIDIKTDKTEEDAWKKLSSIITGTFDVIEVTDKSTGYLRTAWAVEKFGPVTIRTRLVIKMGNDNPLSYKVKIISERSEIALNAREDEKFETWDRLLRKYDNVIPEMQSRLSK